MLFIEGRSQEAIAHFRDVLRINPDYATAHHNLTVALLNLGHADEPIQHQRTAVRLEPGLVAARDLLGAALAAKGVLAGAEAEFRAVLRLKPWLGLGPSGTSRRGLFCVAASGQRTPGGCRGSFASWQSSGKPGQFRNLGPVLLSEFI